MAKLLTIGITTYNDAPFFSELLYTLEMNFQQSPELHNYIDIVVVDDCSTDKEFIQQLEQIPSFMQLIQQEQNYGTPAVGRNLIISMVTSKYLLFIDGDDNILAKLTTLVQELQEKHADLLVSNVRKIENDGVLTYSPFIRSADLFSQEEKTFDQIRKKSIHQTGMWSVFKVNFLQQHMLRYNETDRYEDNYFMVEIYMHNPEIDILQTHYYGWRNNLSSFSHQEENYLQRLNLYEKTLDRLAEDSENIHVP